MTVQAALCQIKLQGTYSSAIQHCMASLVVFGKVKTGVIFWKQASGTPPSLPSLCLGIYKCIPLAIFPKEVMGP